MEKKQLNAEAISGRQISVAVMVAGLSPAAALAGRADWPWVVFWVGVGIALAWVIVRTRRSRPVFQGKRGRVLYILYMVWSALLASRVLSRAAQRLELTSGGSPSFWLLLLVAIPLLWISWGKPAPFFRAVEILWLAMSVALALILLFGFARVEWRYVLSEAQDDWLDSLLAVAELLTPALFVLPYIYNVKDVSGGRGVLWLSALGGVSAALCLITAGILGTAAEQVNHAFYVAAGVLGKSARCEGLLSVLWLLPDLTLAGLLCRVWGVRRWPALGAAIAVCVAISGVGDLISQEIYAIGTLLLLVLTLLLPSSKGKIVVNF